MKIDDKLIHYLEDLSRLRLSDVEQTETMEHLGDILAYMDRLSELDTTGVEGASHPFSSTNVFREDAVAASYDRDALLQNAPAQKGGCFKAPKTVE